MKLPKQSTQRRSLFSSSLALFLLSIFFRIGHSFLLPNNMPKLIKVHHRKVVAGDNKPDVVNPNNSLGSCHVCLAVNTVVGDDGDEAGGGDPTRTTATTTEVVLSEVEDPPVELTETEIELLVRNLKGSFDIPYIPAFMEAQVLKTALTSVCKVAPVALPEGMFIELVAGKVDWSEVEYEVIQMLNEEICIPVISREIQDELVKGICTVLFCPMQDKAARRKMFGRAIQASLNLDSEEEFARMLNDMIDVPFVSEEQEQVVARKLAKSIHAAFETLVPESMREILQNHSSPEELREARTNIVNRLNEMIDIPFQSEVEEEEQFKKIVDFLLERYGLAEGTKMPEEELANIARELSILEEEIEIHKALYDQKTEELSGKMNGLHQRKQSIENVSVLPYFAEC